MIFRITVNDNDFTQYLENACERCRQNLLWDIPIPQEDFDKMSTEYKSEYLYKNFFKFQEWCNVNTLEFNKLSADEIKLLEERVKGNVLKYLKKYYPEKYDYLESQLKVKFLKSFKVNGENGENVYYFPFNCGKWLSQ